ncbi:MAG: hypothetical protein KDC85_06870 [Saprospiraceae bacterium]|nr:hypothetical protein [Saprospiraceae bacterium]MCB9323753.1 hypothetical protein [Lewinellaceae bacterium]
MAGWRDRIIDAAEVAQMYEDNPGVWLLLDVLETGPNGRASKFRLLAQAKDKNDLYDILMEDEAWSWDKKYIFVYSDPDKHCDLI